MLRPRSLVGTATGAVYKHVVDFRVDSASMNLPSPSQAGDVRGERDFGETGPKVDLSKLSINLSLPKR